MTIDPRVGVTFASKMPHTTRWLEMEWPEDHEPTELLSDLDAIGWRLDELTAKWPATPQPIYDDHGNWLTDEDGKLAYTDYKMKSEVHIMPPMGTDIFGEWTPDESKKFLAQVRRVLRKHGFTKVPHWRKTLADML